jgi:cytochrome c7-like protein
MAQLFSPRADVIVRTTLLTVCLLIVLVPLGAMAFARSPIVTGQFRTYAQPVPFAHSMHVSGLRLECGYCHAAAERSATAGLPPTEVCVPCHRNSTLESSLFSAVRESVRTQQPIAWERVNRLPDFVFFNHAAHVRTGVSCDVCHGPIERMDAVYQAAPLTMGWCLDCHRAPERHVSMVDTRIAGWQRADSNRGGALMARYGARRLTSCTTCHR